MEFPQSAPTIPDLEPTPSREALRLIVEVFADGRRAAANLRTSALHLTPGQLELELEAIEQTMLSQIAAICDRYQLQSRSLPRH